VDTARIKKLAQGSRRKLLTQIGSRLDYVLNHDDAYLRAHSAEKETIQKLSESEGREHLVEHVAYTWFNRLAALRFMDARGFFPVRVVTPAPGETQPQILAEVKAGRFADEILKVRAEINGYLDGRVEASEPEREVYKLALLAWCNAMGGILPFLFTAVEDWIALLLPTDLLSADSIVSDFQTGMTDEDCEEIEIIGWLYQFYISEKKDQIIGKVVKSEDIPAATQLFTPNWIVKYMVQNSLGAKWLASYPDSPLRGQMEYYIEPAEQTDEVKAQLAQITPDELDPEKLTLIDPACGSGHILTEAYEVLKAIYLERGYPEQEVPRLILEKNLFGLDIDERAAQLTGFAVMMKGRSDDRRLFERGVELNVMALHDSTGFDAEALANGLELSNYDLRPGDLTELKRLFEHASTFGSLIEVPEELAKKLPRLTHLSETSAQDLFVSAALLSLRSLVRQGRLLARRYDVSVMNPPYMGSGGMNALLRRFAVGNFADSKHDLYACFIERSLSLAKVQGFSAMVTMHGWMFLSSFASIRDRILREKTIHTMAHLGARAFGTISGEVVQTTAFILRNRPLGAFKPAFFRLLAGGEEEKRAKLLEGVSRFDAACQDEFHRIPGSPVAYWLPDWSIFSLPPLKEFAESGGRTKTHNDERFVRSTWEVSIDRYGRHMKWIPYQKGGGFRKWFGEERFVVDWSVSARNEYASHGGLSNSNFWERSGITWSDISSSTTSFRLKTSESEYSSASPTIFLRTGETEAGMLALMNSKPFAWILQVLNPTLHVNPGDALNAPVTAVERTSEPSPIR
jgi:hypothetical protein